MSRISDQELLDDLQRLANELGRSPTREHVTNRGEFGANTYHRRFGGWSEALIKAGLEPTTGNDYSDEELLDEIHRVSQIMDGSVRADDMRECGKHSILTYVERFGSWNDALVEAGLSIQNHHSIPDDDLLDELDRLSDELGHTPRVSDVHEKGEYGITTYQDRFGTWKDALREAGLEPIDRSRWVPKGKNHPRWDGGTTPEYGNDWDEKREGCIVRDDSQCRICGIGREKHQERFGRDLNVHHITPRSEMLESTMNVANNLITLCSQCHAIYEGECVDATADEFVERVGVEA